MAIKLNYKEFHYVIDALVEVRARFQAKLDREDNEDKVVELEGDIQIYDLLIKHFKQEQEEESARSLEPVVLADRELLKHFPDQKNFGIQYQIASILPWEKPLTPEQIGLGSELYVVKYYLPDGPKDSEIRIIVDIANHTIIKYYEGGA